MFKAYADFWKGYVDFSGRSTRSQYWYAALVNFLIAFVAYFLIFIAAVFVGASNGESPAAIVVAGLLYLLLLAFAIAALLPNIAIQVRRLRDAGFHWAFIFLHFVPFGAIALIVMYCQATKPAPTDFYNPYQGQ